ncbi:MAG: cobalamin-binding protein [Planctomycetota bacterium]|nr:cobalamin-binding protein [Planctomycetota bacterium]
MAEQKRAKILANSVMSWIIGMAIGCHPDAATISELPASMKRLSHRTASSDPSESMPFATEVVVIDRLERSIAFKRPPRRIISLSPSTTELLFAIQGGSALVGATSSCNYPPQALSVQRIGVGTMDGISREILVGLEPDLVFCKWDTHKPLIELLEHLGIPVIALGPETLDELFDDARLLGLVTGHQGDAEVLIDAMSDRLATLVARVQTIPPEDQRSVFYEVWDEPLMTVGPKSFIDEIIRLGRMRNIFADADVPYPRVSSEAVLARNPDVIFAPSTHGEKVEFDRLASRPGWSGLSAIENKQVFLIDGDQISRCGPRLLDALEQMLNAVYPMSHHSGVSSP